MAEGHAGEDQRDEVMRVVAAWLKRRAENILAALLAIMFAAFMIQIVSRYLFNFPIGWTIELTVITWLWLVLWGAAFVAREDEEIRIDLIVSMVSRRKRIAIGILVSVALIVLYSISLPASYSYVTFMKVEKTAYLKIPFNWLFSIYLVFLVAIIVRYASIVWRLLHGDDVLAPDDTKMTSAL